MCNKNYYNLFLRLDRAHVHLWFMPLLNTFIIQSWRVIFQCRLECHEVSVWSMLCCWTSSNVQPRLQRGYMPSSTRPGWYSVNKHNFIHIFVFKFSQSHNVLCNIHWYVRVRFLFCFNCQGGTRVQLSTSHFYVSGPLSSVACERFSCRTVVMFGGFLLSLGVMLMAFSTSIFHVYLTYAALGGTSRANPIFYNI